MIINNKIKLLNELRIYQSFGFEYLPNIKPKKQITKITKPLSWHNLEQMVNSCYLCELSKKRNHVMFGVGNKQADIMIIGESPSASEDQSGIWGEGKAGELLTNMIQNVLNIKREDTYITNILKCNNTNITTIVSPANDCKQYLFNQIQLVDPKIIIALGDLALKTLTNNKYDIDTARNINLEYKNIPIVSTYTPNYLLRNPGAKKQTLDDLLKVKTLYNKLN